MLKDNDLKVTPKRVAVLEILQTSFRPVDIEHLGKEIKKRRIKADTVTLYRIIETFIKHNFVKKYDFHEGKFRFELSNRPHHHHAICTNCGDVKDVDVRELEPVVNKISRKSNFKITDHSLEFFGYCSSCR